MAWHVTRWTVDYGEGRLKEVRVPHAWRQDVSVEWEGPAHYRTLIDVPRDQASLLFEGVCYEAVVAIDGQCVAEHRGIWDAFEVDLSAWRGKRVEVSVQVTKNGGERFPVNRVLSGFLPYVYQTFGGIFRDVWILTSEEREQRRREIATRPLPQAQTGYMRGILHWGWYPELGHCNPNEATIRAEVKHIKSMGFNLVKFCLWLPPHRYLEVLQEEGLQAWIELPLWAPAADLFETNAIERELEEMVLQYKHHENIVAWTVGCELSKAPPAFLERMSQRVQALTGCAWVKDNSGGAEMYSVDPREFGTFTDFHPYCDLPFYPPVLDSLEMGPRKGGPILLGEFNDHDVHRDLRKLGEQMPYWASSLKELNAQGVRWQYDLPKFLLSSRFVQEPDAAKHAQLMERSRQKALFIRRFVHEQVRQRDDIQGYILTGLRDTPISSSGVLDDWGNPRFTPEECADWNSEVSVFRIMSRSPRWRRGGNRVGYRDLAHAFPGLVALRWGHANPTGSEVFRWEVTDPQGKRVAESKSKMVYPDGRKVGEGDPIVFEATTPGLYTILAGDSYHDATWTVLVLSRPSFSDCWAVDPTELLEGFLTQESGEIMIATTWTANVKDAIQKGQRVVLILDREGTLPMPFWRESITEVTGVEILDSFEAALATSPDCVLDPKWLEAEFGEFVTVQNRIDTRTYTERPYVARVKNAVITTLRPQGGLGCQPPSIHENPAGQVLLRTLADLTSAVRLA